MSKFKVGDRVRYVRSTNGAHTDAIGQEGEIVNRWYDTAYPYDVKLESGATIYFADDELELADPPKAGDKVRITLERDVYQTTDESHTPYVMVGYHALYLSAGSEDKVEVIERAKPPMIVLPTGKNALIEFPGDNGKTVTAIRNDFDSNRPWSTVIYHNRWPEDSILNNVQKFPGVYRVIFEGEDD